METGWLQPLPPTIFDLYSITNWEERVVLNSDLSFLEKYPHARQYVISRPLNVENALYFDHKPLINHFRDCNHEFYLLKEKISVALPKIREEVEQHKLQIDKNHFLLSETQDKRYIFGNYEFKLILKQNIILGKQSLALKVQKLTLLMYQMEESLISLSELIELSDYLIENPANLLFNYKSLIAIANGKNTGETLKIRRNFEKLQCVLNCGSTLVNFLKNSKNDYSSLMDVELLKKYINPETLYTIDCSAISTKLDDMFYQWLRESDYDIEKLKGKCSIKDIEQMTDDLLSAHCADQEIRGYFVIALQRALYSQHYHPFPNNEADNDHPRIVRKVLKWATDTPQIARLLVPQAPTVSSAVRWINELLFTFFGYDSAFFINEAMMCINKETHDMDNETKVLFTCAVISLSDLPDPVSVSTQILEVITRPAFPKNMRANCNVFVSACQHFEECQSCWKC